MRAFPWTLLFLMFATRACAQEVTANASKSPTAESVPDALTLLAEVLRNQRQIEQILESYTYTKTEEELSLDNHSQTKSKRTQQYEVFYVNGWEVQKLVAKDGKSLSPAEQQKEKQRVGKLVRKYMASGPKEAESSRAKEEDDELHISTFLRAARFVHPRQEQFRGHDEIVFDIEPNPRYHAQNLNEKLVQRLVGVMWIDDRARQVVRLDARLADAARIGGGLLGSVQQGSAAIFEQALINDEVWLPSYLEEHLSGRFLLFKNYREHLVIHYGEYKKFRVDTETTAVLPKPE